MTAPAHPARLELLAPLTGVMMPLDQVPDPVFAQKIVGDGISIDPLVGELLAPASGTIADVQATSHAVSMVTDEGLEILMHIGIDTVALNGEGFTARVKAGDEVKPGDLLVSFDLDTVGAKAKSLLTQILILNGDAYTALTPATGQVTAGKSVALTVELPAGAEQEATPEQSPSADAHHGENVASAAAPVAAAAAPASADGTVTSDPIAIPNPTGLHARPAATLVDIAKRFTSDIKLYSGERSGSAKSIMGIMALGLASGARVTVTATGDDASEAVAAVADAIREGLGEEIPAGTPSTLDTVAVAAVAPSENPDVAASADAAIAQANAAVAAAAPAPAKDPNLLKGVSASPGLGFGTVHRITHEEIEVAENAADPVAERRALDAAIDRSGLELDELQRRLTEEGDKDRSAIFAAHREILGDPELVEVAGGFISEGRSAGYAWKQAYTAFADQLAALDNEVLAGRATDLRDVGQRVLAQLTGQGGGAMELPQDAILIAEDLTPSDTAQFDAEKVAGFATIGGGASSHVAIIARSLGIPAIAGVEARAMDIADGTRAMIDGAAGILRLNLTEDEVTEIRGRQERLAAIKAEEDSHKDEPAITLDGHQVAVVANIGNAKDARNSMEYGAEGVGLLRSEFVFMDRASAPTEQEQAEVYAECSRALKPGQPLVIRTLDVGGDKPLPYLPIPPEENPFLGIRGVRVGFEQPEVLATQVRAILTAADAGAKLYVMFPMIATIEDWREAKRIYDETVAASGLHEAAANVSVGVMMEVPSVAIMARQFAAEEGLDFFSVGTNDLTSYTLAMDRGHPRLAPQVDPCNPSVLAQIGAAAEALHARGKWLGVCGGVASDPQAVPILIGLGVDELSCSIPAIPSVKAAVRRVSAAECQELARQAVTCATPAEVRALVPLEAV